jgi:hypothetical protein
MDQNKNNKKMNSNLAETKILKLSKDNYDYILKKIHQIKSKNLNEDDIEDSKYFLFEPLRKYIIENLSSLSSGFESPYWEKIFLYLEKIDNKYYLETLFNCIIFLEKYMEPASIEKLLQLSFKKYSNEYRKINGENELYLNSFLFYIFDKKIDKLLNTKYRNNIIEIIKSEKSVYIFSLLNYSIKNKNDNLTKSLLHIVYELEIAIEYKLFIFSLSNENEVSEKFIKALTTEKLEPFQEKLNEDSSDPFGGISEETLNNKKKDILIDKNKILKKYLVEKINQKNFEESDFNQLVTIEKISIVFRSIKNREWNFILNILISSHYDEALTIIKNICELLNFNSYSNYWKEFLSIFRTKLKGLSIQELIEYQFLIFCFDLDIKGNEKIDLILSLNNTLKDWEREDIKKNKSDQTRAQTQSEIDMLLDEISFQNIDKIDPDFQGYTSSDVHINKKEDYMLEDLILYHIKVFILNMNYKLEKELSIFLYEIMKTNKLFALDIYPCLVNLYLKGYIEDADWLIDFGILNIGYENIFRPLFYLLQYNEYKFSVSEIIEKKIQS